MLTSRFPGEISGADLPTLTNPAGAGDIAAGKQAIRQDGGVVTGNVTTCSGRARPYRCRWRPLNLATPRRRTWRPGKPSPAPRGWR